MAMDCTDNRSTAYRADRGCVAREFTARVTLLLVCLAGLWFTTRAVMSVELEWRALALGALAFAMSPLTVELTARQSAIRIPLTHPIYLAGVLALGPVGAALPAAFGGVSLLLSGPRDSQPLYKVLYTVLKPSAVCSIAALAYVGGGGSVLCPQDVGSFLPGLLAGIAYVAASALLRGVIEVTKPRETALQPKALAVAAGWSICLVEGYTLAVLYAVAPTYVLLLPATAVVLGRLAMRPSVAEAVSVEDEDVQPELEIAEDEPVIAEADEPPSFVDPLTGLANRRYAEMFLQRELSRSKRLTKALSVAVFDIEGARKLAEDDRETLDAVMADVGERMQAELREYDVVARYSDGRILVVLPESAYDQASAISGRLQRSVSPVSLGGSEAVIHVGVAALHDESESAADLVNAAHRALNRGKPADIPCDQDDLDEAS